MSCLFVFVLKVIGYLIVKIVVKLLVGYMFYELLNFVIGDMYVSFEFVFDYVVVKFLRWLFDKFFYVERMFGM